MVLLLQTQCATPPPLWAYLILFVLFIAIQGKTYFLAPFYSAALCRWPVGAVARALAPMGDQRIAAYCCRADPELLCSGCCGDAVVLPPATQCPGARHG